MYWFCETIDSKTDIIMSNYCHLGTSGFKLMWAWILLQWPGESWKAHHCIPRFYVQCLSLIADLAGRTSHRHSNDVVSHDFKI